MLANAIIEEKVDPRIRRTRMLLEDAFSELIREKDFQSITIQDITARAGINRATFYAHFLISTRCLPTKLTRIFGQKSKSAP